MTTSIHHTGLHKLNLWLKKGNCLTRVALTNNFRAISLCFKPYFSLSRFADDGHCLLIFCTPDYYIYPLYDAAAVCMLYLFYCNFYCPRPYMVIHTLSVRQCTWWHFTPSSSWEGYPLGGLIFAVFPMFVLPFRGKGHGYPFRCFVFFVFWSFSWWSWNLVACSGSDDTCFKLNPVDGLSIVLTGVALVFVLQFIRQQRKLEGVGGHTFERNKWIQGRFFTNITHESVHPDY